jgi:DNA phosphorothioation-dependent restriction protein DptG
MSVPKYELHKLIDEIPDDVNDKVKDFLESLIEKKKKDFYKYLETLPEDDEPLNEESKQLITEAREDFRQGKSKSVGQFKKEIGL